MFSKFLSKIGLSVSKENEIDEEIMHYKNNYEHEKRRVQRLQKKLSSFSKCVRDLSNPLRKMLKCQIECLLSFPTDKDVPKEDLQNSDKKTPTISFLDIQNTITQVGDIVCEYSNKVELQCISILSNYEDTFDVQKEKIITYERANNELERKKGNVRRNERKKKRVPSDDDNLKNLKGQLINSQKRYDIAKNEVMIGLKYCLAVRGEIYDKFFNTFASVNHNSCRELKNKLKELNEDLKSDKDKCLIAVNQSMEIFKGMVDKIEADLVKAQKKEETQWQKQSMSEAKNEKSVDQILSGDRSVVATDPTIETNVPETEENKTE